MKQLAVAILCLGLMCVHAYHNDAWAYEDYDEEGSVSAEADAFAVGVGIGKASVWAPITNYSSVKGYQYQGQGMEYVGNTDVTTVVDGDKIYSYSFGANAPAISPAAGTVGYSWSFLGLLSGGRTKEAPWATTQSRMNWLGKNRWFLTGVYFDKAGRQIKVDEVMLGAMRAEACSYKKWRVVLSHGGLDCKVYTKKVRFNQPEPRMVELKFTPVRTDDR